MAGKKTSRDSWQKQLDQIIQKAAHKKNVDPTCLRVAVVGVGSELNGDDAAGIQVARRLKQATGMPAAFLSIDGGSIPENASGPLRKFNPDLVIFVDAADLGKESGTIAWLDQDKIEGMSASSHTLPLSILGGYLEQELGCTISYLGIQPQRLDFGADLSDTVEESVKMIVAGIIKIYRE